MKSIAERLRFIRESLGIGQVDAATKFGIPVSSYRKYESGPSEPGSEAIAGISRAGINVNWLLTGAGEMLLSASSTAQRLAREIPVNVAPGLAEGFELNAGKRLAGGLSGSTAVRLASERLCAPPESPHAHLRLAEPDAHYHSRDPALLRMAITLAEEAAAVQTLSIGQRVELILTFYARLSKQP